MPLTPDQRAGARFLASNRCAYLADVPGLGKTAQYLRAADLVGADTFTVVCPPVLRSKIQAEVDLWSYVGHDVTPIVTGRDRVPRTGPIAISYALASDPAMHAQLMQRERGPLILDESQFLKSYDARRSLAIVGTGGLISRASHCWWVSGTPAPNNAGELFTFARVSGMWRGTWREYVRAFCLTRYERRSKSDRVVGSKNEEALRDLLAPVFLRRTEVEGRPPLAVDYIPVDGSDAYAELAPEHVHAIRAALAHDDWSLPEVPAMSTVRRLVGLAKVPAAIELARTEIESGHARLLIFGTHIDVLEAIAKGLGPIAHVLNGKTSAKRADEMTARFQDPEHVAPMVLCINMDTGGAGLTLTGASRILVVEQDWVPSKNAQALARAWRRGQKSPVHASFLGIAGSLDDMIARTVTRKVRQIVKLMGDATAEVSF